MPYDIRLYDRTYHKWMKRLDGVCKQIADKEASVK
jgi:hypothetical protein